MPVPCVGLRVSLPVGSLGGQAGDPYPLRYAAAHGTPEVVSLVLEAKADLEKAGSGLPQHGAGPLAKNRVGCSPIFLGLLPGRCDDLIFFPSNPSMSCLASLPLTWDDLIDIRTTQPPSTKPFLGRIGRQSWPGWTKPFLRRSGRQSWL